MSGATIIVDGSGVTATHKGTAIPNIQNIKMSIIGEATEIDMTGAANTAVTTSLLSKLRKIKDITISAKNDPKAFADL